MKDKLLEVELLGQNCTFIILIDNAKFPSIKGVSIYNLPSMNENVLSHFLDYASFRCENAMQVNFNFLLCFLFFWYWGSNQSLTHARQVLYH
jgi:hypothetical protein